MAFHKALKDLNLLDRFLFAEAMEDPVIMQTILEIILGKDILLKYPPQAEKEELIELLRYIEHTTEEVSSSCRSGKIRELQRRIAMIKSSEEIGVKYMQEWEEKVIEQRRAREEGMEEGQAIGRAEGQEYQLFRMIRRKMLKGCEAEGIADILEEDLNHVGKIYDFLKTKMEQTEEESWAEWTRAKNQKK